MTCQTKAFCCYSPSKWPRIGGITDAPRRDVVTLSPLGAPTAPDVSPRIRPSRNSWSETSRKLLPWETLPRLQSMMSISFPSCMRNCTTVWAAPFTAKWSGIDPVKPAKIVLLLHDSGLEWGLDLPTRSSGVHLGAQALVRISVSKENAMDNAGTEAAGFVSVRN